MVEDNKTEAITHLDELITGLHTDISSALNVDQAKEQFDSHVTELREKETKLRDTVTKLELTKKTLHEEMLKRESEEQELLSVIDNLKEQQAALDAKIGGHEQSITSLKKEKETLHALADRMKTVLSDMKSKISSLEKGIAE